MFNRLRKKLFSKIIIVLTINTAGKLFAVLANILLARYFGAKLYGEYVYVYSYILVFAVFASFGLDQGLVKFIPELEIEGEETGEFVTVASIFSILISSIFLSLLWIFSKPISEYILGSANYQNMVVFQSGFIMIYAQILVLSGALQSTNRITLFAFARTLMPEVIFVISILLSLCINSVNANYIIISRYFSFVITLASIVFLCRYNFAKIKRINFKKYILFIKFASTVVLISSMNIIINKLNIFLVGHFLDPKSVGIFNSAAQIALLISFLLVSINQVFSPKIAKYYAEKDINSIQQYYSKINYTMMFVSVIIIVVIMLFGKLILSIFGDEYVSAYNILIVLSIGQLINGITGPCGVILTVTGNAIFNVYINIFMMILITILDLYFIPRFGMIGAAIVSSLSVSITNILKVIIMYKKTGIRPF